MLERVLLYGWGEAGILHVRRCGDNSVREMSQLCNLLCCSLVEDLTDVDVLRTGKIEGLERLTWYLEVLLEIFAVSE
jgi:hypothetical protein